MIKLAEIINNNPMAHMFILDALDKNIKNVLANEEATLKALEKSFVHGPAWIAVAKELNREIFDVK